MRQIPFDETNTVVASVLDDTTILFDVYGRESTMVR
jgi:hypothetical protein